jgi:uncharacterized protein YbjT (DUF2867 family)
VKLVVIGSTGGTGQCFIRQALAAGHHITALALPDTDVGTIHERLEIVRADVRKPETWMRSIEGADGVFSALGATGWNPTTLCRDGIDATLIAMKQVGVKRLVSISSAAIVPNWTPGKVIARILKNIYDDKRALEEAIRASDREWVIVRPIRLYDGPRTTSCEVAVDEAPRGFRVSREDVAGFSLAQFSTDHYLGHAPALAEPLRLMLQPFGDYAARSLRSDNRRGAAVGPS